MKDDVQRMTIGKRTLHFMLVPNLLAGYHVHIYRGYRFYVTCDSFGSHYCLKEVVSDKIENEDDYLKALRYYFDCIIGPINHLC